MAKKLENMRWPETEETNILPVEIVDEGVIFRDVIENEDGKKIAVLVNINDHRLQTQLEVDGKLWLFEMLEDSIYTIIFE